MRGRWLWLAALASCVDLAPPERASPAGGAPSDAGDASVDPSGGGVILARGGGRLYGIDVDATDVYWVDHSKGAVLRIRKDAPDGTTPEIITTGENTVVDVRVFGDAIFWTNSWNNICLRTRKKAGGAVGTAFETNWGGCLRLTVDGTGMWMLGSQTRAVLKYRTDSGGSNAFYTPSSGSRYTAIASDGTKLFLGTSDNRVAVAPSTGPEDDFARAQPAPSDIVTDETRIYWLRADGVVASLEKSRGRQSPKILATGQGGLTRAVLAGAYVYFTAAGAASGAGKVARVSKDGGAVEDLMTNLPGPFGVAVDATDVYVASGDGTVRRTRLPSP